MHHSVMQDGRSQPLTHYYQYYQYFYPAIHPQTPAKTNPHYSEIRG